MAPAIARAFRETDFRRNARLHLEHDVSTCWSRVYGVRLRIGRSRFDRRRACDFFFLHVHDRRFLLASSFFFFFLLKERGVCDRKRHSMALSPERTFGSYFPFTLASSFSFPKAKLLYADDTADIDEERGSGIPPRRTHPATNGKKQRSLIKGGL